jgi:hypothetical protein
MATGLRGAETAGGSGLDAVKNIIRTGAKTADRFDLPVA